MDTGDGELIYLRTSKLVKGLRAWGAGALVLTGAVFGLFGSASANVPGELEPGFAPEVNGPIHSIVLQDDGKVLIGGSFTEVGGQPRSRLARLNPNGSLDGSFIAPSISDSGFDPLQPAVFAIAVQPDGKILIGGRFTLTQDGEFPWSFLARLNANGSLDTTLDRRSHNFRTVYSISVESDGSILVGHESGLARLDPNGSQDGSFGFSTNAPPLAIVVQSDGRLLIGGAFSEVGGQPYSYVARLRDDGSLDPSFDPVIQSYVYSLAAQPDGKILISGRFRGVEGQPRDRLARLNANGTLDTSFRNSRVSDEVDSVTAQPDGKILIGGTFSEVAGQPRSHVARLNVDGSLDTSFRNPKVNDRVDSVVLQPDGKVLVAGFFTEVGGQTRNRIARLQGGSGPPIPNPTATTSGLKTKVTGKSVVVTSRVKVSGAGRIAQRATTGKGKKSRTWCRASKTVSAAGSHTLQCNLGSKGRKALRKGSLSLTLRTTFTPTAGEAVTANRKLTVKRKR